MSATNRDTQRTGRDASVSASPIAGDQVSPLNTPDVTMIPSAAVAPTVTSTAPATAAALPTDEGGDSAIVTPPEEEIIHGTDDRIDYYRITNARSRRDADCVASIFLDTQISSNQHGDVVLNLPTMGDRFNLCAGEKFEEQPSGAIATAFLVAKDVMATAGHVIDEVPGRDVRRMRFLFGYKMTTSTSNPTVFPQNQLYSGKQLLAYVRNQYHSTGADWALVRLDRPVPDHRVASVRRTGTVPEGTQVHVIGHPKGLPLKFADNATITDNKFPTNGQPEDCFSTNLDTFQANSGSPVFNSLTHEVEGILVRGTEGSDLTEARDPENYVCYRWTVRPQTPGYSECTRATEMRSKLGPGWQEIDDNVTSIAIAATGSQLYQLRTKGQILRYTGTPLAGWTTIGSDSRTVEIVADGNLVYQRHRDTGAIFRYSTSTITGWQQIGGNPLTKTLAAGGGMLYQLQSDGVIWRYSTSPTPGWVKLDNNPKTVAIAAAGGKLYQLHDTGQIYQYMDVPMYGWALLDNNSNTKAIAAGGGKLYQSHKTGEVWEYTNTPLIGWALLSNQSNTKQIVTDGTRLYRLDTAGRVYRYTGVPLTGWQLLDDSQDTISIAAAGGELYQLRNSGSTGSIRRLVE